MSVRIYDDAFIGRVTELWATGETSVKIAAKLDITKNALLGLVHRLRLPSRASPIKAAAVKDPQRAITRRAKKTTLPPLPQLELPIAPKPVFVAPTPKPAPTPRPVSRSRTCTWIEGPVNGPVCGAPAVQGASWCEEHGRRVFINWGEVRANRVVAR